MYPVKIKICGLSRIEDIEAVNEAQPDYIGFVFAPSKRKVSKEEAARLSNYLSPNIKKVGVFVNENYEVVQEIVESCGLDVVQLHGEENPKECSRFTCEVWKAFSISRNQDFDKVMGYDTSAWVFDAFTPDVRGGSGKTFQWELLENRKWERPWWIAGGLSVDNVDKALQLQPFGVDISSGVESNGRKDGKKIIEFVRRVRNYER